MYAPGDVRVEQRDDPEIMDPTDAVIRLSATCVCGSDLWNWRGINPVTEPQPMGHEYAGTVVAAGSEVRNVKVGDFVVGSFFASDNTCEICLAGYQSRCPHLEPIGALGAQAEYLRVPLADGTLVATHGQPDAACSPASWRLPTSSAPGGSPPSPPTCGRARPWRSSATARSACSPCSPPGSLARSGSSR